MLKPCPSLSLKNLDLKMKTKMKTKIKPTNLIKKTIICLSLLLTLTAGLFQTARAVEPVTTITLILFAGKIYALGGRAASGLTTMGSMAITGAIARESEKEIRNLIRTISDNISRAGSEAYGAPTEEETKQAMEKEATLKIMKLEYENLLREVQLNKNLTVVNITKNEIKNQGVGFILSSLEVPDEAQGKAPGAWTIQKAIEQGYEVSKKGGEVITSTFNIVKGVWTATGNIVSGRIFGNNIKFGKLSEEDKAFYQALKDGQANRIKVAITKTQWDYFVNTASKEEFKKYLRGESDKFSQLPLSIQKKYWSQTWLFSDQIDEIHDLMKKARESGNYADAIKQIVEKYPKYADLFKSLTKSADGDTKDLMNKINQAFKAEADKQKEELKKAEAEEPPPSPKPEVQQPQENLPTTAEEVIDEAKQLSPQQTKASCLAYFDRMCRGLCGQESEGYDFCMQGCLGNTASCNNLP